MANYSNAVAQDACEKQYEGLGARRTARAAKLTRQGVLGVASLSAVVVAACATPGGRSGSTGPAQGLKADATVPVLFLQSAGPVEQELVQQAQARWQEQHPRGPRAEFLVQPGSVAEKLTPLLAGGTPPALASMDASQGVQFVDRGEVAPLDDFIKRDKYDLSDYIPVSIEQYRWKDRLYGLVRDFSHRALWVNLEAFAREGLTPPAGDYTSARGWDFTQFTDAARRLTKTDGSATRYGFVVEQGLRGGYGQFIWANGGALFDKDYKRCTVDEERAVEALQLMQDLRYRHRVAPDAAALQERRAAGQPTGNDQMFLDGSAAMAIFPATRIGEARRQGKVTWDLAVNPQGKGKRVTTGGGVGWYQVKPFAHQEEAWAVMAYLTSADVHRLTADVRFPGRRSVLDWWLAQSPDQAPKNRSVARTGQDAMALNPVFPLWGQIEQQVFTPQLARLWDNKATAREVAREIATQANRMLAEQPAQR
jgi:multiple sugar transport system substrate-binding protein